MALSDHRVVGKKLEECISGLSKEFCESMSVAEYYPERFRCDTTIDLAKLANQAALAGHHDGFRSARSYFDIRSMQESAGFLRKNEKGE